MSVLQRLQGKQTIRAVAEADAQAAAAQKRESGDSQRDVNLVAVDGIECSTSAAAPKGAPAMGMLEHA